MRNPYFLLMYTYYTIYTLLLREIIICVGKDHLYHRVNGSDSKSVIFTVSSKTMVDYFLKLRSVERSDFHVITTSVERYAIPAVTLIVRNIDYVDLSEALEKSIR